MNLNTNKNVWTNLKGNNDLYRLDRNVYVRWTTPTVRSGVRRNRQNRTRLETQNFSMILYAKKYRIINRPHILRLEFSDGKNISIVAG